MQYYSPEQIPMVMQVPDVAKILGIGKNTAYNLVKDGKIKPIYIGKSIRITREALLVFLNSDGIS